MDLFTSLTPEDKKINLLFIGGSISVLTIELVYLGLLISIPPIKQMPLNASFDK